jgi:hypothetical protein
MAVLFGQHLALTGLDNGNGILTFHSGNAGDGREQLCSGTLAVAADLRSTMTHVHPHEKTDSDRLTSRLVACCAPLL